jgi:putative oxidoreductase
MTMARPAQADQRKRGLIRLLKRTNGVVGAIAHPSFTQLALRVALAVPFWRSGVNKWDGFLQLNDVAVLLFSSEFQLHLPGGPYAFPAPGLFAFAAGTAEIVLPILLVLGLATRFAALGLLAMTVVVQLTVPEGWPIHLTWAAMALALMAWGPGQISLDHLIASRGTKAATAPNGDRD